MIVATSLLAALLAAGPALFVGVDNEIAMVRGRITRPHGWAAKRVARVLSVPDELGDSRIVYAAQPGKGVNARFLKRMEPFFARGGSRSGRPTPRACSVRLLRERCKADPLVWNPNWYGSAFYGIHLGKHPVTLRR